MYVYEIGSRVRINDASNASLHEKEGTIVSRTEHANTYEVEMSETGNRLWFGERFLLLLDVPPSPDEVIADLTDQLYNVSKELDRYRTMYLGDMAHWENTMRDVKDREGWCDEGTNKIIGELNGGFIGWQLDYYEQDFEIEVEIRATIVTTARVMVSATSEEAAYESVIDDPEAYFSPTAELADAAQYVDDYEVDVA